MKKLLIAACLLAIGTVTNVFADNEPLFHVKIACQIPEIEGVTLTFSLNFNTLEEATTFSEEIITNPEHLTGFTCTVK